MAGKKGKGKQPEGIKKNKGMTLGVFVVVIIAVLAGTIGKGDHSAIPYTYKTIEKLPHDPKAFTQGLLFHDGFFYESTGLRGESTLRKVKVETGQVVKRHSLADIYFAEGLALFNDKLYQLTYQEGKTFVYDATTFEELQTHTYDGEGWGLTHNGTHLIMSNGTESLTFRDPETFKIVRTLQVTESGEPVKKLNELEYIEGEVWANIWRSKRIVRIDPDSGHVLGRIDMRGLPPYKDRHGEEDYLNGIAYDAAGKRIFVTGKKYAFVYQIQVEAKP